MTISALLSLPFLTRTMVERKINLVMQAMEEATKARAKHNSSS